LGRLAASGVRVPGRTARVGENFGLGLKLDDDGSITLLQPTASRLHGRPDGDHLFGAQGA
jgi:hypothetical protein